MSRSSPDQLARINRTDATALWRYDGERFSRNEDGTFSMDSSEMAEPYQWTYDCLMRTGLFSHVKPE